MQIFLEFIEKAKAHTVYIQTHDTPDPDALASAFGLQRILKNYGIQATIIYQGRIDKVNTKRMTSEFGIEIFSYEEVYDNLSESDWIICVDSQKAGGNIEDFVGDEVACIDHHPTYKDVDYLYKDVRTVGSCATIIAGYFKKLEIEVTSDVATALIYGIKMDTNQFTRGVTLDDIEMYAFLFPKQDDARLSRLEINNIEMNDLKVYGEAISNIKVYGKIGFSAIKFACDNAMIASAADFILGLDEVDVAIVYSYRDDEIKFSVRSEVADVDCGLLIRNALGDLGGGGGHAAMAGGSIPAENIEKLGSFPDQKIENLFMEAYKSPFLCDCYAK